MVYLLDPQPGETVLELAAGPGDTGFLAAERLGASGRLISTDIALEMVEAARGRAAELGLVNVEFRVADAQAVDLPDACVDGALCRWGYMLMPNPARALGETRRVLRAGGRVALAVWAESERNPWGTAAGRALIELGHVERPDPDAPGPFRLGEERRLLALVREAGLDVIEAGEVTVTWRAESFEHWWEIQSDLSRLISTTLGELSPAERDRFRRTMARNLEPYADGGGALVIPGVCRVVLARRS
jgi:SAM-dependent methyltransferase